MQHYNISLESLKHISDGEYSPTVIKWIRAEKQKIDVLLGQYKQQEHILYTRAVENKTVFPVFQQQWASYLMRKIVMPKMYLGDIERIMKLDHLKGI
jgi:hypothetical protein